MADLDDLLCTTERRAEAAAAGPGVLGRVIRLDRGMASVETEAGTVRVETTGPSPVVVGDWVVVAGEQLIVLERTTELVRRSGYRRDARQAIAANVDLVLVVRALDTELRLNRLASLLVIAHDSGARPVVVLSKADCARDLDAVLAVAAEGLPGEEILAVSAVTGLHMDWLGDLVRNQTVVVLGESGAGKSTITNVLLGHEHLATSAVRRDGQGRHTPPHRELVTLPGGGVLIDTPGIREAAAVGEGEGIDRTFADLALLATTCRFSDCSHEGTPGCAIAAALEGGEVSPDRVANYLDEVARQAVFDRRLEERARLKGRGRRRP